MTINHGPVDHPLNVAGSPEHEHYMNVWETVLQELDGLGVRGVALIALVPTEGGGIFSISSVAQQSPITREQLITSGYREIFRWHSQLMEKKPAPGIRGAFARWINRIWAKRLGITADAPPLGGRRDLH